MEVIYISNLDPECFHPLLDNDMNEDDLSDFISPCVAYDTANPMVSMFRYRVKSYMDDSFFITNFNTIVPVGFAQVFGRTG